MSRHCRLSLRLFLLRLAMGVKDLGMDSEVEEGRHEAVLRTGRHDGDGVSRQERQGKWVGNS
jgi:hypothetical protein